MGLCGEICYLKHIQIPKRIFSIDGKISKRNRSREKALPAPFEFSCYVIEVTCSSPIRLCSPISKSPAVNGARRLNVEAGQEFCGLNRRCRMRFLVRVGRKRFPASHSASCGWSLKSWTRLGVTCRVFSRVWRSVSSQSGGL